MTTLTVSTPDGAFTVHYSERGLQRLAFPDTSNASCQNESQSSGNMHVWHKLTTRAVRDILAGRTPEELPPLDLSAGTEFQQEVWREMLKIKRGGAMSYGELARSIGRPGAMRAVGGACGANPIPLIVPCHRVLAANRKLGGFSSGLDWKRKLLAREGIQLD
jgi:methylated-DNA-[protein]-cysteine S-methyltransferase